MVTFVWFLESGVCKPKFCFECLAFAPVNFQYNFMISFVIMKIIVIIKNSSVENYCL